MHPFGGNSICPRCSKAVYAAEQVMGPGRKLYHKPCLACTLCNKRLDSYTLLEHDQKPYCKPCHVKNFGTRDLRQANLPHREETLPLSTSPISTSPVRQNTFIPPGPNRFTPSPSRSPILDSFAEKSGIFSASVSPPASPFRTSYNTSDRNSTAPSTPPPLLRPTHTWTPPASPAYRGSPKQEDEPEMPEQDEPDIQPQEETEDESESRDTFDTPPPPRFSSSATRAQPLSPSYTGGYGTPTNSGRFGGIPRTVPLTHGYSRSLDLNASPSLSPFSSATLGRSNSTAGPHTPTKMYSPILPTATGTGMGSGSRYGVALNITGNGAGIGSGSPVRKWGGGTPVCPKCAKSVFFAEQVKAVGKTWHKNCLRCTECSTLLDSSRLTEKDGEPFCHRCYSKVHGPQGAGYALLGKAGG